MSSEWDKAKAKFAEHWAEASACGVRNHMINAAFGWLILLAGIGITFGLGPVIMAIGATFIAISLG